jgi:hypothetical protein
MKKYSAATYRCLNIINGIEINQQRFAAGFILVLLLGLV